MNNFLFILDATNIYVKKLTQDIDEVYTKLLRMYGCRYHWKIIYKYNSS